MSLKDCYIKSEYRSLIDNVVQDFYIPLLNEAVTYRRAVGFFSSSSLVDISKGIAAINRLYTDENLISEEVEFHDLQMRIKKALLSLSDREREIIKMRNGFYNNRPFSLEEVGLKFGVTRERIRQIEAKALTKLRHPSKRKYYDR